MVIANDCEALPAKFPTVTMKVKVPVVVGVPLITPAELSERPFGRLPLESAQCKGAAPLALSEAL
jgi:hypothetical protein